MLTYRSLPINKGKRLVKLSFSFTPKSKYWRAGFKLISPNDGIWPLSSALQSLLFHLSNRGSDRKTIGIWRYTSKAIQPKTDLMSIKDREITVEMNVNKNNYLSCYVNGEKYFNDKINPVLLERVCVLGWGDGKPCKVEFKNIEFETV